MKLKNKVVIVTGGSMGIGEAITKRFMLEGAKVIVFDIIKPKFKVEFYSVDIRDELQIKKAFSKIDKLDILVNNAGVYEPTGYVEDTTKEMLDKVIDTNFKGTYLMSKYALPLIKKRNGNIINIASALGVNPEIESPAYCSSKAAVIMLTKCMAQAYAKLIRVNAILPGPIDTPLLRKSFPTQKEIEEYAKTNPMQKIGKPEDVANVALFLASEEAKYITAATYEVDGGESSSRISGY